MAGQVRAWAILGAAMVGVVGAAWAGPTEANEAARQASGAKQHAEWKAMEPVRLLLFAATDRLDIGLDAKGRASIAGQAVSRRVLYQVLRGVGEKQPVAVRLSIDPSTPGCHVIGLIEQLHYEGLREIDLGVSIGEWQLTGRQRIDAGSATTEGVAEALGELKPRKQAGDNPGAAPPAVMEIALPDSLAYRRLQPLIKQIAEAGVDRISVRHREMKLTTIERREGGANAQPHPEPDALLKATREHLLTLARRMSHMHAALSKAYDGGSAIDRKVMPLTTTELRHRNRAKQAIGDDASLLDAYETARSIEQDMFTIHRDALALRMAATDGRMTMARGWSQARAMLLYPVHAELDRRSLKAPGKDGEVGPFARALARAIVEVRTMHETCRRLATQHGSAGSGTQSSGGLTVDMTGPPPAMMPGRRSDIDCGKINWLFVDTWHIIGPFPGDPDRRELDRTFPPEAEINLDQTYTGKDGSKLRWRTVNTGRFRHVGDEEHTDWKIIPPTEVEHGVYYAWIEFHSDKPGKQWFAVGCRDYGKLWLNGRPVWQGSKEPHAHTPFDDIELLDLRRGHNQLLIRIAATKQPSFSLLMSRHRK